MGEVLYPSVRWAQNKDDVNLQVELRNVETPSVRITEKRIEFEAVAEGANGRHQYSFGVDLFGLLNSENSTYSITDNCINIVLRKKNPSNENRKEKLFWPRLTEKADKLPWLKIDFNKWIDPDDSGSENEDVKRPSFNQDFDMDAFEKKQADEMWESMARDKNFRIGSSFSLTKPYLATYNFAMFIGFLLILIDLSVGYYSTSAEYFPKVWAQVSGKMFCCQIAQFLEIAHASLGYVKGSPSASALQVCGRGFVLFIVLNGEARMHDKPFVFYLFSVWSLVEIIRYPYYLASTFHKDIGIITWLRYTAWIILYPLGFLCEGIIILRAMPYFEETQKYSQQLPNKFNMAFDFPSVLKLYMFFCFLPGIVLLMSHMRRLRLKKLQKRKVK